MKDSEWLEVFEWFIHLDTQSILRKLRRWQAFHRFSESDLGYLHFLYAGQHFKLIDFSTAYKHYQECHRLTKSNFVHFLMVTLAFSMSLQTNFSFSQKMLWIQRAMASEKFHIPGLLQQASILLELGQLDEALKVYTILSQQLPIVEISIVCARIYAQLGQFPMTSIYYRVSKKRDPTHPALESLKEQLHALALTCKQEAIILLHSKKHEAALKKVHQGLELVPEDLDLILIKAEAWMHLAKEKDALALLQPLDSLAAKSLSTKILIKWVRRLMDSKNYSEALPLVKLLVSSDSMYILLLGEVLVNLKLYKEVLDLDLPSTCSFLHTAHLELGKECYDTHQWSEAKDHFEKAWQISKTSNLALMLANTFIHIEKDMALAYLNEALLLDPENKQAKDKHLVWVGQFEKQVGKHSLEPTHLQVATYSDKRRFS